MVGELTKNRVSVRNGVAMALRYGVARDVDLAPLGAILAVSFGLVPDGAAGWFDKIGHENIRVIRDGDDVVGGLLLIPMGQYYGARSVPTMGIAGVGVSPGSRGRGIASELMRGAMRELKRGGVALSALYPASIPLYRRAGYELAGGTWRFELAARDLPKSPPSYAVRTFEPADEAQVRDVYAAHVRTRNGWLDRGPYVWERTRRVWEGVPTRGHVLVSGSRIDGYVFYRQKMVGVALELRVSDMAARTPAAYRDVISFLAAHKSLADRVMWYGGIDDPWLALFRDRHYELRLHHHWMLRVVDVRAALEARGYPSEADTSLTLELRDDVLRKQSGSYRVRVSAGRATVRDGGRGGVELDVRTLASVYAGHLDMQTAARLGLARGSARAIARAAMVFGGPPPSMNDLF